MYVKGISLLLFFTICQLLIDKHELSLTNTYLFSCREEVQLLTFADTHFYTYIERFRPELMVFARTPRDIEEEIRKDHPNLFRTGPSTSSSGSHAVPSQNAQSQPEIPQPIPDRSQSVIGIESDSAEDLSEDLR